jgi:type IV secretion system protein VirB11
MLRTALGPAIANFLEDPSIVEVMLNPDGRLWIDRLSSGLEDSGRVMSAADGERIVRLVAHHVGAEVHAGRPRVSADLPETGERFEGLLPPVVTAPAFAIRVGDHTKLSAVVRLGRATIASLPCAEHPASRQ